jgi:DNA-binding MarR family transcriptional regulator
MPGRKTPDSPADASRPSALDAHLGFWMRLVSNQVSAAFAKAIQERGVSVSEWVALRHLLEAPATHGELVAALGMTKGAASKIVRALEEKRLIARTPDARDGRSEALRLTASGRALVPKLAALADANDARFFGHLQAQERAALQRTLESIARRSGIDAVPID